MKPRLETIAKIIVVSLIILGGLLAGYEIIMYGKPFVL